MASSRKEAKASGLKRFNTGAPCSKGHIAERFTSSGGCVLCSAQSYKKWSAENSEQERLSRKARYESDKEKVKKQRADWMSRNPGAHAASVRLWRQCNPDAARAIKANRRALEAGAEGSYKAADLLRILIDQKRSCAGCQADLAVTGYHADHKQPLSKGGSNGAENIQLLCPSCNCRKSTKSYAEWRSSL